MGKKGGYWDEIRPLEMGRKIPCKARVQHLLIVLMKFGLALCGRDTGGGWDTRGWGLA